MSDELNLSLTIGDASFTGSGPVARVEAALERFAELIADREEGDPAGGESNVKREEGKAAKQTKPPKKPDTKVPLPKFLESDDIKGNTKIATAIVAWAADHQGENGLTKGEIETMWKGTKNKLPGNLSRDLGAAVKDSWLEKDADTYRINGYGRDAIGLPS